VFIRLDGGKDCVRTWYFTEREALTRHLCAHPEQFVLSNVTCPKS
jgi:hypothetical protein